MKPNPYLKFMLMLGISFLVMYSVMFLNVASLAHIHLSLTRTYMTLLMIAPMALMMVIMIGHMYPNKQRNMAIIITSLGVFVLALVGLRAQVPIGDAQYMRAMIPHHSSAILTSREADLMDPEVRKLANDIIDAQEREIAQMEAILSRMN
ncbi:MAG TPA: DUF305 domain-containing protein [Flavobacteriales bacterium]|nr:DUF305 domain-containing protein [Flavobacteriales bacterium]